VPSDPPPGTLGILLLSGGHERAHYAFVLATGAAAVGRAVVLFATGFSSLTCAYSGTDRSREALAAACALSVRHGFSLRIATFVPRAHTMYPPETGFDAEDMVAAQWAEQAVGLHDDAVSWCAKHGVTDPEVVVGRGDGWEGALTSIPWRPDDVLVFGSSRLGPLARVFLGSTASKIMRYAPRPVLVVPAGSTEWSD